jgi:hypothetical protein
MGRGSIFSEEVFLGTWTDAALVNNVLQNEGIETVVVSSNVSPRTLRSVCVLDTHELDRARDIVQRYMNGEPLIDQRTIRSWRCTSCNELIEGQFNACWKCGRARI